jgi:hypothetical protein
MAVRPGPRRDFPARARGCGLRSAPFASGKAAPGDFGEGREKIDVRGERLGRARLSTFPASARTTSAGAAEPRAAFFPPHAGVEHLDAPAAVPLSFMKMTSVSRLDAPLPQLRQQLADVLVDVVDHAEEMRELLGSRPCPRKARRPRAWRCRGCAARWWGCRRRTVCRPRFGIASTRGLAEEHVGAIALGLHELAVVQDGGVEILVAGRVAAGAGIGLADAAGAVDEHLVKPRAEG